MRKGDKRARTRAHLIEAAASVIGEKGFERTSLEDIAACAGLTRGAIYGNFANKEDLFLAVVAARWRPIVPPVQTGADLPTQMAALAEALIAAMPERRAASIGAASFQLYALTHPAMRARIAEANARTYAFLAQSLPPEAGETAALFVRAMHALTDGLMMLHALTPELIDAHVVRAAFAMMAAGAGPAPENANT